MLARKRRSIRSRSRSYLAAAAAERSRLTRSMHSVSRQTSASSMHSDLRPWSDKIGKRDACVCGGLRPRHTPCQRGISSRQLSKEWRRGGPGGNLGTKREPNSLRRAQLARSVKRTRRHRHGPPRCRRGARRRLSSSPQRRTQRAPGTRRRRHLPYLRQLNMAWPQRSVRDRATIQ